MSEISKAVKAFDSGDPLSDEELDILIKFYSDLLTPLSLLGCSFKLAYNEAKQRLNLLEQFKFHRNYR